MDSILETLKKVIGPSASYDEFDTDLIIYANSVFFTLNQLGVGPEEPFKIEDDSATWDNFSTDSEIEAVKAYLILKVKLYFDPPSNSSLQSAMTEQTRELEFRLNVAVDPGGT